MSRILKCRKCGWKTDVHKAVRWVTCCEGKKMKEVKK